MKKFYLFLMSVIVAFAAVSASAQTFQGRKAPKKALTENQLNFKEKGLVGKTFNAATPAPMNKVEPKSTKGKKTPDRATTVIKEAPEGVVKYYTHSGSAYYRSSVNIVQGNQYDLITMVFTDNNEVYMLDPVSYMNANSYVKGTVEGNKIVVQLPQTVHETGQGYNLEVAWVNVDTSGTLLYSSGMADRETNSATFTIDGTTISLDNSSDAHVLGGVWDDDTWCGAGDWGSVYTETTLEETITPPEDLTSTSYFYNGKSYYSGKSHTFSSTVQVIRDGDDVYIQGLATGDADKEILPEAWAKGTLEDGILTIPMGQYMGSYSGSSVYLLGNDGDNPGDVTFIYDEENDIFTLENSMFINGKPDVIYFYAYTMSGALISQEEPVEPVYQLVEVPETATIEDDWTIEASGSSSVNTTARVAFDGDDVYIQGIPYYFSDAWIKGTLEAGVASFPSGQLVGEDEYGQEYICSLDGDPIEFAYDVENNKFTLSSEYILEAAEPVYSSGISVWFYYSSMTIYKGEYTEPEVVVAPDDLQTDKYVWTGRILSFDDDNNPVYSDFTYFVLWGFDGDDVYIQGLCKDLPEAWVKGTLGDDGSITLAKGQFFGISDAWSSWGFTYPHYLVGFSEEGVCDIVLNYDSESNTFSTDTYLIDNKTPNELNYYLIYTENKFCLLNEVAGKPANPEITSVIIEDTTYPRIFLSIPLVTTDGFDMNPDKVYYRLFTDVEHDIQPLPFSPDVYDKFNNMGIYEVLYEIPYTYQDNWDIYEGGSIIYLNQDSEFLATVNRFGVQSVYYGGMTEMESKSRDVAFNESDIVWYLVKQFYIPTGVADLKAAEKENVTYFNVLGQKSDKPFDGVNIVVKKKNDGTTVVNKVLK